jgi:hypothetical protein
VVVATLGVAVAVALASPPSTGWSTAYAFLTGNVAQTGGGTTYNDVSDVPDVALSNGTGDMAAVWLETATDAGQSTTSVDVSVNNGTGWSTDEPLAVDGSLADPFSNSEGEIDQPQVAEDSSGDAMAVWIDGGSVWYSYAAAGAGFSASGTDLYPASGGYATDLHLAFDGSGNAVLVWSAYNGSTWSVYSDITTSPGVFPAGGPTLIASGLPSNPQATVAVSQQNSAVIAYVDHGVGVYYSYVVTDADVFPTPSLGYSTATPVNDPVAAISYDGTGEVAWLQGTPGSVEVNTALVDASFSTGPFGYTNAATGTGDYSDLAIAMNPNLVTTNPVGPVEDDDTTALAFYDATQSQVDALVLPGVDVTDENTWAGNDDPISEPANIAQQPQLSMSGTVADEDTVTMLWQTGTGSTANQIDAITSTSAGAFVGQPVQTIQDGSSTTGPGGQSGTSEVAAGCTSATCDSLAADTNGDLVATWLQTDNDSNVQVAADCYQTGETGPVTATTTTLTSTGSFNAASCFSSYPDDDTTTDPTTTSTSTTSATPTTTTPTSTTPTTTTSTSTTPATPAPVLDQSSDVSKTSGTVKVELPGTTKFVTVSSSRQIPLGAVINATNGTVTITSALPNHKTGTATYRAGEFTLSQSRSGAISAKLVGSSFAGCPKPSGGKSAHEQGHSLAHTARKSTKKKKPGAPVRSLWTNAKGNYTTTGKNGSAAVLGTEWLTRDQCDGTYFSVLKTSDDPHGEIKVTVFYPHRHTVLLKRGHSLLAPASGY